MHFDAGGLRGGLPLLPDGQLGLIRNLTAGEIVGQVLVALEDNRAALAPQTNIVLMGQGEPLLNYDAMMAALRILLDPKGDRHFAEARHAFDQRHRSRHRAAWRRRRCGRSWRFRSTRRPTSSATRSCPSTASIRSKSLLDACRNYPLRPWEYLTFEYVLLGGFNDSPEDARRVVRLLANLRAKVNLIPWNPGDLPYEEPDAARVEEFRRVLADKGVPAFVRYSRGQDVMAACGQLALAEAAVG